MQRSTERILATHVGSLARPHDLLEVMREREHGRPYDADGFAKRVRPRSPTWWPSRSEPGSTW